MVTILSIRTGFRNFLFCALLVMTKGSFANDHKTVIAIGEPTVGYLKPDRKSEVIFAYKKLTVLSSITGMGATKNDFILVKGTNGKRANKNVSSIPDLWIPSEQVVYLAEMKKWEGCWPISKLVLEDGVVDVEMRFNKNGIGKVIYSEGNGTEVPMTIYLFKDVVHLRDVVNKTSYFFSLYDSNMLKSLDVDIVSQEHRKCADNSQGIHPKKQ